MARLFGRKKDEVPMGEVPLPPSEMVDNVKDSEKVQVFSFYEIQLLQLLGAVLDEQRESRKVLEAILKKTEE